MVATAGSVAAGDGPARTTSASRITTPAGNALYGRLLDLFFARRDVFAYQWYSAERQVGGYAKACQHRPPWIVGRCPEKAPDTPCSRCPKFQAIAADEGIIDRHLHGLVTLGSYQLGNDGTGVRWACLDFDDHGETSEKELQDAVALARLSLESLNVPTVTEMSGGQGWRCHLWAFFMAPVPAIKAKVVLDAALAQCGLADAPFVERFPKQSRALNGYGNLVKVPFGIHRKSGRRSQFVTPHGEVIPSVSAALDAIRPVDPAVLDFTIDMKHLALVDQPLTAPEPVKNFDLPPEAMNRILSRCWYFREVERRQMASDARVDYEDWFNYLLMFARFGVEGYERIVAFSRLDERFDPDYTATIVAYIRQRGYHAPSCRRLRSGPGKVLCPCDPLECGAA